MIKWRHDTQMEAIAVISAVAMAGAALLVAVSVLLSKTVERLGVPVLLLFLALGMLAGVDGPLGIEFDNAGIAQTVGIVALAFILFSGGLDTEWGAVRPVLWKAVSLSTLGVALTAGLVAVAAAWLMGFDAKKAFLLGAIVSSTDAAAVFAVLRSRRASLKGHVRPLLEMESASNDPMAVFLTLGTLGAFLMQPLSPMGWAVGFALQMSLGLALGALAGKGSLWLLNKARLDYDGLYPVLTQALIMLTYGATASLNGNGFLAVYVMGLVMGQSPFIHKRTVQRFQDGVAWFMQISMFLVLGLLVYPSQLLQVAGAGLLLSGILMFVARPVAVWASLLLARTDWRSKTMVSWVGLRGAAPIVLATFPLLAKVDEAQTLFHLVFFIVLTSVMVQGATIPWLARRLRLDAPLAPRKRYPLEFDRMHGAEADLVDFFVPYGSRAAGKALVDIALPRDSLIVLVNRNEQFIVPAGDTVLEEGDVLLILTADHNLPQVRSALSLLE